MLDKIFSKLGYTRKNKYNLTDAERLKSLEIRQLRAQAKILRAQLEVRQMERSLNEVDKIPIEEQLQSFFLGLLMSKVQNIGVTPNIPQKELIPAENSQVVTDAAENHAAGKALLYEELSEEDIRSYLSTVPKPIIAQAKRLNDEQLSAELKSRLGISEQNIKKVIKVVRKWQN